jgi:hypothetical protein
MNPLLPADPPLELLEVELLAALLFVDQRPLVGAAGLLDWRLDGEVTRMLQAGRVSGARGEQLVVRAGAKLKAQWVLLLGSGKRGECSERHMKTLLKELWQSCGRAGFKRIGVALPLDFQEGLAASEGLAAIPEELNVQYLFVDDAAMA